MCVHICLHKTDFKNAWKKWNQWLLWCPDFKIYVQLFIIYICHELSEHCSPTHIFSIQMYIYVCMCIYVYTYKYTYTHTCMYMLIYTHTHKYKSLMTRSHPVKPSRFCVCMHMWGCLSHSLLPLTLCRPIYDPDLLCYISQPLHCFCPFRFLWNHNKFTKCTDSRSMPSCANFNSLVSHLITLFHSFLICEMKMVSMVLSGYQS